MSPTRPTSVTSHPGLLDALPPVFSGRVRLLGPAAQVNPQHERILTPDALAFVLDLADRFRPAVDHLLAERQRRQQELDARATRGEPILGFRPDTTHIRAADWRCAPLPFPLLDRRVEITGPVERKKIGRAHV